VEHVGGDLGHARHASRTGHFVLRGLQLRQSATQLRRLSFELARALGDLLGQQPIAPL